MRVSKAAYLRRLLKVQDALLCPFIFLLLVFYSWTVGELTVAEHASHLRLTLIIALAGAVSAFYTSSKLHGSTVLDHLLFAVRFCVIVGGFILLIEISRRGGSIDPDLLRTFLFGLGLVLFCNRLFLRWWYLIGRREHPENHLKVLVVGTGPRAQRLVETYSSHVAWEVDVVAMLDPLEDAGSPQEINGVPVYRGTHRIHELLATEVIDEVVVCLPRSLIDDIHEVVAECEEQAICLRFMADFYDIKSDQISLQHLGDIPMLTIEPVAMDERNLFIKRVIDMLGAFTALVLLSPILLLVAVLIRLDSPGPALFVQERVGLNKRRFRMFKFRSMREDAEAVMAELEHLNEADGPIFKMDHDPRVTRVGNWLRRSSIDELPQLFNVLIGHMSLVGPRPMSVRDVDRFSRAIQRRRFSVRPGLACLREISGRSRLSFERWLELDLQYIETWSLQLDFKIMLALVPAVLKGDGAT